MNSSLHEARLRFLQCWGEMGSCWGINKTMAQIHAVLGDIEVAFAWRGRGVQSRSGIAAFYSQHPDFDATAPRAALISA